jgi:hypothetical protein
MKFDDSFEVPVPVGVVWDALTDIERVYPCLPGAELTELREGEFHGVVTMKLGPITASYKGSARFEELDEQNRTLVIRAEGRDRHGQGTARARVVATLEARGDQQTLVRMVNEVDITGKAAQFGRGIIVDVSKEIMGQFAANLRDAVFSPPEARPAPATGLTNGAGSAEPASVPLGVGPLARKLVARRARDHAGALLAAGGLVLLLVAWRARR